MPVFTFEVWLTGLITAIIILLLLSPFAFRQKAWMKRVSYPFAVLMLLNGLGHIAGSFYLGRLAPGVYSAPLLLVGVAIYFKCAWDFASTGKGTPAPIDPPKRLVARGLYRFVRNPMYVGVLLTLLGEAWLFSSWALLIYAAIVITWQHLFVVFYEEPALKRKFGESYSEYLARTPRWIPNPRSLFNGG